MKKILAAFMLCMAVGLSTTGIAYAETIIESNTLEYDFRTGEAVAQEALVITRTGGETIQAGAGVYNTKTEDGRLTGGVVATQPDGRATSNILVITGAGDHLSAQGNAVIKKQDKTLRADQVEYYQKRGYMETVGSWAQLRLDDGSKLDAGHIDYSEGSGIANAVGNVQLESPARKLTASGDRAVYNTKLEDGTLELLGNARATQDGNTATGNRLILRGTGGRTAEGFGQVKLVYVPQSQVQHPTLEEKLAVLVGTPSEEGVV